MPPSKHDKSIGRECTKSHKSFVVLHIHVWYGIFIYFGKFGCLTTSRGLSSREL